MESTLRVKKKGVVLPQHMPALRLSGSLASPPKTIHSKDLSLGMKAVTIQLQWSAPASRDSSQALIKKAKC